MTPEQFARMMNPVAQKNYDEGKADTIKAVLAILDRYYLWHKASDGTEYTVGSEIERLVKELGK